MRIGIRRNTKASPSTEEASAPPTRSAATPPEGRANRIFPRKPARSDGETASENPNAPRDSSPTGTLRVAAGHSRAPATKAADSAPAKIKKANKSPTAKVPAATPPKQASDADSQGDKNSEMIGRLDSFLDELAEGHRVVMDQVVTWLTGLGDLEREVQRSVEALNPLLQKWSIEICFLLRMKEPRRFGELKQGLTGIGSRTLSQRLKELEAQGIVQRQVFAEVPVRVEYRLTPKGSRMGDLFLPIIAHLRITAWREDSAKQGIKV